MAEVLAKNYEAIGSVFTITCGNCMLAFEQDASDGEFTCPHCSYDNVVALEFTPPKLKGISRATLNFKENRGNLSQEIKDKIEEKLAQAQERRNRPRPRQR